MEWEGPWSKEGLEWEGLWREPRPLEFCLLSFWDGDCYDFSQTNMADTSQFYGHTHMLTEVPNGILKDPA